VLNATQALTVIAEIDKGKRAWLDRHLAAIAKHPKTNPIFRPGELPDTHFTRFVIIDDPDLAPLLVWESNHDGRHVDYLAAVAREVPSIDLVLGCCKDYPSEGTSDATWIDWMLAHSYRSQAFYCAYRGMPRAQVANDRGVHDAIREVVDRDRETLGKLPLHEIQRRIADHVRTTRPELDIEPQCEDRLRWLAAKILAGLTVLLLLPFAAIAFVPWLRTLRRKEHNDISVVYHRPVHDDAHNQRVEDVFRQNQLTHVVDIKRGWFRLFTLWATLTVVDALASVIFVHGDLGGITSIHFARWVIVRDTRKHKRKRHRLVFFSNYDGSWDSYLGEFVDRASRGLTAVWSNTVGFPRTKDLLDEGARDEEAFKQWTRDHQIPTQVWWSGVPDSTVQNVRDDIWIRRRLDRRLSSEELPVWLSKL
jgi:hypothetical protein